jgi:cytidylate kinase
MPASREVNMSLITMTETIGCNGLAIARRVAEGLGIELFDDWRLREEAARMGLKDEKLKGFQEKAPDWFDRLLGNQPEMYLELMASVVYEAARRAEGVILGHGSQMLLHDFDCATHVLVTAHEESRIHALVHEMNLTPEAARKLIHQRDNRKKNFFRFAFHKDWDDPSLYDLCINPDKIGPERAAQLIIETARSPEMKACSSYALEALERLSHTKRIEATLREMNLRHAGLRVEMPERGVARISGVLFRHEDKGRIPAVVGKIPGVEKVQVEDVMVAPVGND